MYVAACYPVGTGMCHNMEGLLQHYLEFVNLKEAAEAHLSLHMTKCHIVRNLMKWLICKLY